MGRVRPGSPTVARQGTRLLNWSLGMRTRVVGSPPAGPGMLICNHVSYLDVPVLAPLVQGSFVARADVRDGPVIGPIAVSFQTLFIDRDRRLDVGRVVGQIRLTLEAGRSVIVFPEGTTSPGHTVGPFRSSLLEPAARLGLPVYPAALAYHTAAGDPPAPEAVAWWGDMDFLPHLRRLTRLRRIDATVAFGDNPITGPDRKHLATSLTEAVRALHQGIR